MSYTELYAFNKQGTAKFIGETSNSHRSAAAIWYQLGLKYIWSDYKGIREDDYQKVWDLIFDTRLTTEKIVLWTTFDYIVVDKEDIPFVIDAFHAYEGETSLKEQAEIFQKAFDSGKYIAFAWNQTSVNGDNWRNWGIYANWRRGVPYNIFKENGTFWSSGKHHNLFKSFEGLFWKE